jgi:hypothetical protein
MFKGEYARMKRNPLLKIALFLILVSISHSYLDSQTCSCAATTLFDPIEYTTLKNRQWRFELTYKYHALNDLVEGTKKVLDDTRRRRTAQSLLLDIRHALFRSLTLRAVLGFTRQGRDVGISEAMPVNTQGLGDGLLTIQYSPVHYSRTSRTEIALGAGVKIPMGKSDARIIGIASEDMQPGTGSWDGVIWVYASRIIPLLKGLEIFAGVSARFNGSNTRSYSFGNEVISSIGTRLQTTKNLSFSLFTRYRWADADSRFEGKIPNTGGQWVYLVPSITVNIARNWGVKTEGEIPIYRRLNGFRQFTSTYSISVSIFYLI